MFIHSSHLPQRLPPEAYHSHGHYQHELDAIFLSSWHYVGTADQLDQVGSYFTLALFGRPLIIYRSESGPRCFLNVCAHRFSRLTAAEHGRCSPLRCQYHGWEYDDNGLTRRIPDAESFRPMKDMHLGLTRYRLETCGQLLFVCFAKDGPSLHEFLGETFERCSAIFSDRHRRVGSRTCEVAANWKVKIENALESYHIDCVHEKTFVRRPPAENCEHELADRSTTFRTAEPPASGIQRWFDAAIYELIGVPQDRVYQQTIHYPNFMFGKAGLFSWIESVTPLAPDRSRVVFTMFGQLGRSNPVSQVAWRLFAFFATRFAFKALGEDLRIVPEVQHGLQSTVHPSEGLISIREERLFHFQEYVRSAVGGG